MGDEPRGDEGVMVLTAGLGENKDAARRRRRWRFHDAEVDAEIG
jgi:hypothetical protein